MAARYRACIRAAHAYFLLEWYLVQLPIDCIFCEFYALIFEQLGVLVDYPVERHADLPRPREYFRIFDGRFVIQMVLINRSDAFVHLQLITVKITGAVEPALVDEIARIDDEGFAVPFAVRPAHPRIRWRIAV